MIHRARTGSGLNLIIDWGGRRTGFEIKLATAVGTRDAAGLVQARQDGVIADGTALHHG